MVSVCLLVTVCLSVATRQTIQLLLPPFWLWYCGGHNFYVLYKNVNPALTLIKNSIISNSIKNLQTQVLSTRTWVFYNAAISILSMRKAVLSYWKQIIWTAPAAVKIFRNSTCNVDAYAGRTEFVACGGKLCTYTSFVLVLTLLTALFNIFTCKCSVKLSLY